MHGQIVFNHKIIRAENSFLPAISAAALYGKGIFTTIAVHDSKAFLWEKHWRRLTANAERIALDLSAFSETTVKNLLLKIITENDLRSGRARVTFFDETPSSIWQIEPKTKTSILIQTADNRAVSGNPRLTISPFSVNSKSPLAGVKSCNYLENILAVEQAKKNGFDEAVLENERGEIVSAATANIFWTKGEKIFTPHLETGCLAGTTREFVCENFTVAEVKADLNELNEADDIFLTSAGIGVVQIAEFQNRKFCRAPHDLTRLIYNSR